MDETVKTRCERERKGGSDARTGLGSALRPQVRHLMVARALSRSFLAKCAAMARLKSSSSSRRT